LVNGAITKVILAGPFILDMAKVMTMDALFWFIFCVVFISPSLAVVLDRVEFLHYIYLKLLYLKINYHKTRGKLNSKRWERGAATEKSYI